jgi:hypothetical protein
VKSPASVASAGASRHGGHAPLAASVALVSSKRSVRAPRSSRRHRRHAVERASGHVAVALEEIVCELGEALSGAIAAVEMVAAARHVARVVSAGIDLDTARRIAVQRGAERVYGSRVRPVARERVHVGGHGPRARRFRCTARSSEASRSSCRASPVPSLRSLLHRTSRRRRGSPRRTGPRPGARDNASARCGASRPPWRLAGRNARGRSFAVRNPRRRRRTDRPGRAARVQ